MNPPSPLARLLSYTRPYRGRMAWALVAMVLYAIGNGGITMLIKIAIDDVLPHGSRLGLVVWGVIGLSLLKGIGSYGSSYLMTNVGQRVVMDLRNELYRHILGQSASFFAQRSTGQLMSRMNDIGHVQQVVSETFADLARETLGLVVLAGVLFYYDAWLAVFCIISAPLIVYPLVRLGQRVRQTSKRSLEALSNLSHMSAEGLTGHRIVKAFGTEETEARRFKGAGYQLFRTNMKVTAALASLPPLMELLGGVGMAVALWYGSREIASGRLTVGELTTFIAALLSMYGPAKKLSRVNANIQQAMAASEGIFEILDTHSEVTQAEGALPLPSFAREIEFRDVTFGYDDKSQRILRGVSLAVPAGQMLAIVGRSGAGKTTLVNLLPRFYDVSSGSILVDGTDIRHATLASLRAQIGIVTQETVLFADTVSANIAYGAANATREQIEAAARAAHAHEFIVGLPEGYDTFIGERGGKLSGGQRQRLAIARALLKNAPILILDEATSALDTESELLVQEALSNLMMNRTSFVIAHRLSTIRRADKIIVVERGRIVEVGRHDELLARPSGAYAALYEMQLLEGKKTERRGGQVGHAGQEGLEGQDGRVGRVGHIGKVGKVGS